MKKKNSNAAVATANSAKEETTLKVVHNANDTTTEVKTTEPNLQTEAPAETGKKSIKLIFEKGNKLQGLMDQHDVLNETAKKLDSFHLGSDKLTDSLQIRDGKGNEFKTNNSAIIEKCVEMIKGEVEAKTIQLETQLQLLEAA